MENYYTQKWSTKYLSEVNICRCYLREITISDITTPNVTYIDTRYLLVTSQ